MLESLRPCPGLYIIVYDHDTPSELFFAGSSYDGSINLQPAEMTPMTMTSTLPTIAPLIAPAPGRASDADQVLVIAGVDGAGYARYLHARGERSRPKMIYLDGDLILVSPGRPHERLNARVGTFLYEVIASLRLQVLRLGQMTWRRGDGPGVEGDQTYYLAHEPLVRDKEIDLEVDPPPDLAIEVVHTHKADHALEIYGRLEVPEVWVCDVNRVAILIRQPDGTYQAAEQSLALPFLSAAEVFAQIQQPAGMTEADWIDGVRCWVREVLVPRVHPE